MDLETLDAVALGISDDLPLQANVCYLRTRTGVGAAVKRDGNRHIQITQGVFQDVHQLDGAGLGGHVRELAKLQPGAGNDATAKLGWLGIQSGLVERTG